jgi:purine nucleosidase/pyrimidine-specific ribonucleoside hydrolase
MKKTTSNPTPLWLDTDIGDDTDDIFALALILASPELDLQGVSTVFGETEQRARLAQTLLQLHNRTDVPVHAGCGHLLLGPGRMEVMPNGPMSREPIAQGPCAKPAGRLPALSPVHAVDALAAHLHTHPQTTPVAIGPLTNLATLLLQDPAAAAKVSRFVVMGGEFKRAMWEWNIHCDPSSAACVIASGVPIDFIPWDIGMTCTISPAQLDRLFDSSSATGRLLTRAVKLWRKAKPTLHHLPRLFDPMAVAVLLHPEWFEWRRGRVTVSFAPATFAHTQFTPEAKGPHRVAWEVKKTAAVRKVWSRILSL